MKNIQRKISHEDDMELVLTRRCGIKDITKENWGLSDDNKNCIRIYGGSTGAIIQIRSENSITSNSKVKREMIATADYVSKYEIRKIIKHLTRIHDTMKDGV